MKKLVFLFALLTLLIFSLAFKKSTINTFPLFGYLIVIDPGHGGLDPGAVYDGELEKNYNLDFAKTLKSKLEHLGASVLMTRSADYDLSISNTHRKKSDFDNRILLIDETSANMYISLHMNYLKETKYYGAQVFYSDVNKNNKTLAETIQSELNIFFKLNKKVKRIPSDKYMYNKINTKGVLIEFGFISSPKDRKNLLNEEYKNDLAKSIAKSIVTYLM